MSNTFLTSLTVLDVKSVTNLSSISFFVNANGTSKFVRGDELSRHVSRKNFIIAAMSGNPGSMASNSAMYWQLAPYDPWSCWNTNTKCYFSIPFDGFIQAKASMCVSYGSEYWMGPTVLVNDVPWSKKKYDGISVNGYGRIAYTIQTAPIPVSSGDLVSFALDMEAASAVVKYLNTWAVIERTG